MKTRFNIAVVIPCYRVREKILFVLQRIGPEVRKIYVVDDLCPEKSGQYVRENTNDPRVVILSNAKNMGVGGAVLTGIKQAIQDGADVIVKIDGDGQMDPACVPQFVLPILRGDADFTKGNRFFNFSSLASMPVLRKFGNLVLSFLTKLSSGYWHIFDPTNGYFAIHSGVAAFLEHDKLDSRYFFESDLLFRLNVLDAVIYDIPLQARYEDEKSSLVIADVIPEFLWKNMRNFFKRIAYNYFIRDLNLASIFLVLGGILSVFGIVFGVLKWMTSIETGTVASAGTVMLAAFPLILGVTMLMSFLNYDMSRRNFFPLQKRIYSSLRGLEEEKSFEN